MPLCRFEVDCPISILHLGFPAPDLDDAAYDVAVQILVQSTNSLIVQTNQSIVGKRRSVMRCAFEQPVRVEPGVMYKVVYKLKVIYSQMQLMSLPAEFNFNKTSCLGFSGTGYILC